MLSPQRLVVLKRIDCLNAIGSAYDKKLLLIKLVCCWIFLNIYKNAEASIANLGLTT